MYSAVILKQTNPLFSEDAILQIENESVKGLIAKKNEQIAQYEEENERLREMIRELKRQRFGPSGSAGRVKSRPAYLTKLRSRVGNL